MTDAKIKIAPPKIKIAQIKLKSTLHYISSHASLIGTIFKFLVQEISAIVEENIDIRIGCKKSEKIREFKKSAQ